MISVAVIKNDKTGLWEVRTRYKDWTGATKQKTKRGFQKRSEAVEWEQSFLLSSSKDPDMLFGDFVELYKKDIGPRLRQNTWLSKESVIEIGRASCRERV